MSNNTPGFLILAAGLSSRFGGSKLTASLHKKPVIQHTLDKIITFSLPITVIYNPDNEALYQCLDNYDIEKIPFPNKELGIGNSISFGVEHTQSWNGWIICLADMPWISLDTYQKSIAILKGDTTLSSAQNYTSQAKYHNEKIISRPFVSNNPSLNTQKQTFGHPVGFQKGFKQELLALKGDEGARSIISQHKSSLLPFEVQDYGILLDIDRPSDLNRDPESF